MLLGSRNSKAGDAAAASLRSGFDVVALNFDLADPTTIECAMNDLKHSGHQVDVLVNNASVLHEKPLLDLTDAEVADSIAVHLTFVVTRYESVDSPTD